MKSVRGNKTSVGPFKVQMKDENGDIVMFRGKPVTKMISDNKGMADELNKTYAAVFTKDDPTKPIPAVKSKLSGNEPLVTVEFTEKKVYEQLKKIRPSSSPGPDRMWPRLLVLLSETIAKPLAELFTSSMDEGVVPKDWKDSNIAPIIKPQKPRYEPPSYRGVAMTSQVCKCMERITKDTILKYIERYRLLSTNQHGGRPGRSTLTNLLCWLEEIGERVDNGESIDALYCDFLKAYDVVSHAKLRAKLEKRFGIQGKLLIWISEWLRERRQRVVISGEASEWTEVLSSIIQGSVLSGILFLLYIDDIEDELEEPEPIPHIVETVNESQEEANTKPTIISIFVDDTKIARTVSNETDQCKMQNLVNRLGEWSIRWDLKFNVEKCKIFHTGRNNPGYNYTLYGQTLSCTEAEKDVGVILTPDLRPSKMVARAATRANQKLGAMARAITWRDKYTWINLYKVFVRPKLEYCSQAWCPWTIGDKDTLEKVQRRAVRMVTTLPHNMSYEDKLKLLGLTTLVERRERGDMIQMFRSLAGHDSVGHNPFFKLESEAQRPGLPTRARCGYLNVVPPKAGRTEQRRNFWSQRSVTPWNNLSDNAKMSSSVNVFKNQYDSDMTKDRKE